MSASRACPVKCLARGGLLGLVAVLLLVAGCQDQGPKIESRLDEGFKKLFTPRKTPQQYMLVAVSSEDPDARRDAVAQVSASKLYDREWAIKGFIAIALLESEPQTRCVAIRALARTGDPRATETALKILNYRDYPPEEVWPPVGLCRWDATAALADLSANHKVPDEYVEQVYKTLLDRLRNDGERHAQIAAARGLACYPREETVKALIEGLRHEDFAVAHQCEEALVQLTGQTHDANVLAWEEWLAANHDSLFAHAGEIPASRQPPYRNAWQKSWYDTVELIRWLWPGSKEE
jgi:HEAT repeat protein